MEKYFTPEEATRSLTLVKPIVEDILAKMGRAQALHDAIKAERSRLENGSEKGFSETAFMEKLHQAEKLLNEVEYHMKELESVGVLLKDLKIGLVDFPCVYMERVIYLCWMPGERNVGFWHETDRGFTDRREIDHSFSFVSSM